MNAPDFIRVGGVLYRARPSQEEAPEASKYVRHEGFLYKLAALPQVQSHAANALAALQRGMHDARAGEGAVKQVAALRDALLGKHYPLAQRVWESIQPSVLALMDNLEGAAKTHFGRAALDLDEYLTDLAKTASVAEPKLPAYITVGEHLYRRRQ